MIMGTIRLRSRRLLMLAALSALGTSRAFTILPRAASATLASASSSWSTRAPSSESLRRQPVRLYATNKDDGILGKVKNVAKSILPASWFQSEEEKRAAIERKQVQDEITGGLKEMLKDAPLPVRMLGGMIGPLFGSALSGMAETLREQQSAMEDVQADAQRYLQSDARVADLLGDPVQMGDMFSQSSSSSSINGKTTTRIDLGFGVSGSRASGIARLSAENGVIKQLQVQAGGRVLEVDLSGPRRKKSSSIPDDNIIEAEIIEKDTKRQ